MSKIVAAEDKPKYIDHWRSILWREWHHCGDRDYSRRLFEATYRNPLRSANRWVYVLQSRPYIYEVEAALYTACTESYAARNAWERRLERLAEEKEKNTSIDTLIANLSDHHWLERFIARHVLFYRGGQAASALEKLANSGVELQTARWLLMSIAVDTTDRLAKQAHTLMCPNCLIYCHHHQVQLPSGLPLTFYGCRWCRQGRDFKVRGQDIGLVLDNRKMAEWRLEKDDHLAINWIRQRELFDFGWVEIIQATDEEVERFAVQVGNDTDPYRRGRYPDMRCFVSDDCSLSANSLRILERTFGVVYIG